METRPISDRSVPQSSKPKSNGQSQDIETTTDLTHNDNSKQTSEPSTDSETASESMPQPPSGQSDTASTLEINDPTTETNPQTESSYPREANTIYALILILITQNYTDIDACKFLIQPLFVRHVHSLPSSFSFFGTHYSKFSFFRGHISTYLHKSSTTLTKINKMPAFKLILFTSNHHSCQHQKNATLRHKLLQ